MSTFYITTAIDYINGKPHLGHAYEKIGADVAARYNKLKGVDTLFVTGTDEHSLNVVKKAEEQGLNAKEFCDNMAQHFLELCRVLDITYDRFIRTTDDDHKETVQSIVKKAWERGYIYEGTYSGHYCESCEAFLDEGALIEGKCPYHPTREVKWLEEHNYFFALSKFQDKLLKHFEEHPKFIQPESRRNEILNRLKEGLNDVSISRSSMKWGVPFPMDPEHVVYVWFDALINYVTAAGYISDPDKFQRYWPANYHIIGKDITWFHSVIWPAILMAVDIPLPKAIFGHGFINLKGQRLSKSAGLIVDPFDLVDRFGVDAVRYFLMKAVPWGNDGDFSFEGLVTTYNNDLANDFGNLLSRTTAMINKYFNGVIPQQGDVEPMDEALSALGKEVVNNYFAAMDELLYNNALSELLRLINSANKYIEDSAPWELNKDSAKRSRLGTVMYNLAEVLRITSIALTPFMPNSPRKVWEQLGLPGNPEAQGSKLSWGNLEAGIKINRGVPLFPRLDIDEVLAEIQEAQNDKPAEPMPIAKEQDEVSDQEETPLISIDDFAKVQLKVGKVIEAKQHENADKLLVLKVDIGSEVRQIVAGIAKHYKPEELVNKSIVIVSNLKPAKLRCVESQGMLLAASTVGDSTLKLVTIDGQIPAGSKIR